MAMALLCVTTNRLVTTDRNCGYELDLDLNLPLAGIGFILVALFLRVRTPPGSLWEKLSRIDWLCVYFLLQCSSSGYS